MVIGHSLWLLMRSVSIELVTVSGMTGMCCVTLWALMGYTQDIRHGYAWWNGETKASIRRGIWRMAVS